MHFCNERVAEAPAATAVPTLTALALLVLLFTDIGKSLPLSVYHKHWTDTKQSEEEKAKTVLSDELFKYRAICRDAITTPSTQGKLEQATKKKQCGCSDIARILYAYICTAYELAQAMKSFTRAKYTLSMTHSKEGKSNGGRWHRTRVYRCTQCIYNKDSPG